MQSFREFLKFINTLYLKNKQHITETPKKFLKDRLNLEVDDDPEIHINETINKKLDAKLKINDEETNILLGIGGSGPTKKESQQKHLLK